MDPMAIIKKNTLPWIQKIIHFIYRVPNELGDELSKIAK